MNNDDRIRRAMQNHEIPKELEPENIAKMLKERNIKEISIYQNEQELQGILLLQQPVFTCYRCAVCLWP